MQLQPSNGLGQLFLCHREQLLKEWGGNLFLGVVVLTCSLEHQTFNPSDAKGSFNTRIYRKVLLLSPVDAVPVSAGPQ